jgi:hypothetical protein
MTTPGGGAHHATPCYAMLRMLTTSRARPTGFYHGVGAPTAPKLRGSDLLSQIETFVTLCGMVWVRAKVLGQMGWTTSPYLRAGALSCPSLAIYGPGSSGGSGLYTVHGRAFLTSLGRPSLCAPEALRGTLGSANMSVPGGHIPPCSAHRLLSKGRSSQVTGLRPFALPRSYAAGCFLCTLRAR